MKYRRTTFPPVARRYEQFWRRIQQNNDPRLPRFRGWKILLATADIPLPTLRS